MNHELQNVQAGFGKGRGTRDQTVNICWIIEKAREFQKNIWVSDMPKPLTTWVTTNYGKFFKGWEYQTTLPNSWEICMHVKKQQLETDMEQWTGSIGNQLGKEYIKALYYNPAYLTYMQSTSWKMLDWIKHKLESRLQGEISIISGMQMIPPYGRRLRGTEEPLDESKRGEWKSCLKTQHSKNKDHGIQSHHFTANSWGNNENSERLYFGVSKITADGDCSHEIKRHLLLRRKTMTKLDSMLRKQS